MRKVLFVIDSLGCGGAEKSLVSLLPLLDYNNVKVDLMTVKRGGIFERFVPDNITIHPFPPIYGIRKGWQIVCRLYFSFLLRFFYLIGVKTHGAEVKWMAMKSSYPKLQDEYDIAIAYQQGFPTYYVATKVKALKKYAWINADIQKAGYKESFNRPYYTKIDRVVAVSEALHQLLKQMNYVNPAKLFTIYDILNVDLIRGMAKEKGFEDVLPENTWRIVTVGRLVHQKNYFLAVDTARLLKRKKIKFRWYFIGEGNEQPMIEKLIADYGLQQEVRLLGMLPNPYPYIAHCDIYVQTSRCEGYGLTLCEARILHKPEVCTNFPIAFDQIKDGVNGLIAEMTPESVCDKIMQLVHNKELRETLIANTYKENNRTAITESAKVNALLLE